MKPNYMFHIPGTKGIFELAEIQRRASLPKKDKEHLKLPAVVRVKDIRTGTPLGCMAYDMALAKFS